MKMPDIYKKYFATKGAKRDSVLINAGAALYFRQSKSIKGRSELAAVQIDSGAALKTLDAFIAESN